MALVNIADRTEAAQRPILSVDHTLLKQVEMELQRIAIAWFPCEFILARYMY